MATRRAFYAGRGAGATRRPRTERVLSSRAVVIGLGVDLVELERVERALQRWGGRLVEKLMGPDEGGRLPAPAADRALALALAIAAKEAASKALGTGWSRGVRWRDVVVDPGPPASVRLEGGAAARARRLGGARAVVAMLEVRGGLVLGEVWLTS
jgi:holo-[acyl-carrier protein] synthase